MRLIQAKVRCVEGVEDSGWIVPGRQTTVIYGPQGSGKKHLLQALQALNPIYDIQSENPFINHPEVWRQGEHAKRVFPEKKTAVFMIFSAEPDLVLNLNSIDPALIETDRIEVGRRLDRSRWITFVEISASSRWSEISARIKTLRDRLKQSAEGRKLCLKSDFIDTLMETDRLKGDVAVMCFNWLKSIEPYLAEEDISLLNTCMQITGRAHRFAAARVEVERWLPPTIVVQREYAIQNEYPFSLFQKNDTGFDPVVDLLRRLYNEYRLKISTNNALLSENLHKYGTEISSIMPEGIVLPELVLDRAGFRITGYSQENILEQRVQLIALIALLAIVDYGRRPLLLLDQLDEGMDEKSAGIFINWLQEFGRLNQLILTTGSSQTMSRSGWQAVYTIGPRGLMENGIFAV